MTNHCQRFEALLLQASERSHWSAEMEAHYQQCTDCRSMAQLHLSAMAWGGQIRKEREELLDMPAPSLPVRASQAHTPSDSDAHQGLFFRWLRGPVLGWSVAAAVVAVLLWAGLQHKPVTPQKEKHQVAAPHKPRPAADQERPLDLRIASQTRRKKPNPRRETRRPTWQALSGVTDGEGSLELLDADPDHDPASDPGLFSHDSEVERQLVLSRQLIQLAFADLDPAPISQKLPSALEPLQNLVQELTPTTTLQ